MKRLDTITALAMLLLAGGVVVGTSGLEFWDEYGPSTRFMPIWVAAVTAVLALLLILEVRRREGDVPADWPDRTGVRRVASIFAAIVGFVVVAPWLGFVVATAVFVVGLLLVVERRPVLPSLFTAAFTAGIIQAVFVWWLSIALPKGVLGL